MQIIFKFNESDFAELQPLLRQKTYKSFLSFHMKIKRKEGR